MKTLIKNADIFGTKSNILIDGERIEDIGDVAEADLIIDAEGLSAMPAFFDIHTHLREPGYEGKEDIESGAKAAVNGGYSAVCCMPNTNPVCDNPYIVSYIIERAKKAGYAKVYPIGAATKEEKSQELSQIGKMKQAGVVALSDDGVPVANANMMRMAMEYASDFDLTVISHCEDLSLAAGGVANEGKNAAKAGLRGISRAAEEVMVAREIVLSETLDLPVHIAHISTKGSAQLIREAKARGVKVTAETCPHYFAATDELILGYNTMAKVNPPLRTEQDRLAIIEAIKDGTVDAIATDHAPHKATDKEVEFDCAANGISGLETAYALSYTYLVKTGAITAERLSELMTKQPAQIVKCECGALQKGGLADIVLVDNNKSYNIDKSKFVSKGKNTPFDGLKVFGKVEYTFVNGKMLKSKGVIL